MSKLVLGYCPIGNAGAINPFDAIFSHKVDIEKDGLKEVDAVVFWGGQDIHPSFYKQVAHKSSEAGHVPSKRDMFEWKAMLYCKQHNIPMIGVCRGAQLMCAFAGGWLIQDVNGHGSPHDMMTKEGTIMQTTSCHHQMMYPYDIPHELIAWATPRRSHVFWGESSTDQLKCMTDKREPEIVYFPTVKGLAIQGHPEWERHNQTQFSQYVNNLVMDYLFDTVDV